MKKIKVAVDIGNSNVVIGLFIENKWEKVYRLSSRKNITYWSFKNKLKKIISLNDFNPSNVESVIISSVVPTLTDVVRMSCSDMLSENITIIKSKEVKLVKIKIDDINELGIRNEYESEDVMKIGRQDATRTNNSSFLHESITVLTKAKTNCCPESK